MPTSLTVADAGRCRDRRPGPPRPRRQRVRLAAGHDAADDHHADHDRRHHPDDHDARPRPPRSPVQVSRRAGRPPDRPGIPRLLVRVPGRARLHRSRPARDQPRARPADPRPEPEPVPGPAHRRQQRRRDLVAEPGREAHARHQVHAHPQLAGHHAGARGADRRAADPRSEPQAEQRRRDGRPRRARSEPGSAATSTRSRSATSPSSIRSRRTTTSDRTTRRSIRGRGPTTAPPTSRRWRGSPSHCAGFPLAGPATGSYRWLTRLPKLFTAEPKLKVVTYHRYPLIRCFTQPGDPGYPSIPNLLSRELLARPARRRRALHRPRPRRTAPRSGSTSSNSVACKGQPGVSDTFASSLWMLDTLFAMARSGVDGVNIHTLPEAVYHPFTFEQVDGRWLGDGRARSTTACCCSPRPRRPAHGSWPSPRRPTPTSGSAPRSPRRA